MTAVSRTGARADLRLGIHIVQENLVTCFWPETVDVCFSAMLILNMFSLDRLMISTSTYHHYPRAPKVWSLFPVVLLQSKSDNHRWEPV